MCYEKFESKLHAAIKATGEESVCPAALFIGEYQPKKITDGLSQLVDSDYECEESGLGEVLLKQIFLSEKFTHQQIISLYRWGVCIKGQDYEKGFLLPWFYEEGYNTLVDRLSGKGKAGKASEDELRSLIVQFLAEDGSPMPDPYYVVQLANQVDFGTLDCVHEVLSATVENDCLLNWVIPEFYQTYRTLIQSLLKGN
ncbi:hypothetical protein N9L26_01440 [Candidatus Pacebacteria bacterium]|nr:hypothetical protein [Candidatus Paceibacterota bacterium]